MALRRYYSLEQVRADLNSGSVTVHSLVQYYLEQIQKNQKLNAFLEVFDEEALKLAQQVDEKLKNGTAGKLAGMVLAIKDNIVYKGHKVSASSQILKGFESLFSATAIERLIQEDAIIIGRTNCDEFAMGASNENSSYGPVLNGLGNDLVPGGSSGGSAVAVQMDMCLAALGSDTGGSIRQPASFTGIYGYKPSYGMISRWGLIAYASSFDQIGPLCSSISDTQILSEIMAGADEHDASMLRQTKWEFNKEADHSKKKIAYISECLENEGIHPDVKSETLKLIEQLKADGHTVEPVSFPYLDALVPCYYVLTTAEASSNLARFQGLQYGYRSPNATDLESTFKKSRSEGFGPEVKRRIMLGTFVLSSDYYDAYYTKAQKVRALIKASTEAIFNNYDFILSPTAPTPAFKLGEKAANPIAMYLADIFTVQANIAGVPAISIPGLKSSDGLPFGVQLMAPFKQDSHLLQFSNTLAGYLK